MNTPTRTFKEIRDFFERECKVHKDNLSETNTRLSNKFSIIKTKIDTVDIKKSDEVEKASNLSINQITIKKEDNECELVDIKDNIAATNCLDDNVRKDGESIIKSNPQIISDMSSCEKPNNTNTESEKLLLF